MSIRALPPTPSVFKSATVEDRPVSRKGTERIDRLERSSASSKSSPGLPRSSALKAFDSVKATSTGPARARLMVNNNEAWAARWELLGAATRSVDAAYFSVSDDVFGYAFLGHLLKKQQEGVKVRLLSDAMADLSTGIEVQHRDVVQELENAGAEVAFYHPTWARPLELIGRRYKFVASNHDKAFVVDGRSAITGGRNIAADYFTDPKDDPKAWRDSDVLLHGPAAAKGITSAIERELSSHAVDEVGADDLGNLVPHDVELLGAYAMMDLWLNDPPLSEAEKTELRESEEAQREALRELLARTTARLPALGVERELSWSDLENLQLHAEQLVGQLELRGAAQTHDLTAGVRQTEAKIIDQTSAAAGDGALGFTDFTEALARMAVGARERIVIQNPYVVLTEPMLRTLEKAGERGVKIDILTNSPSSTDSALTQAFFLEDWPMILARIPNARIFAFTGERKMHAKTAIVDDEVALVSSYNMDLLSNKVNGEIGALMASRDFAADLRESIERDMADPANAVKEYTIERDEQGRAALKDGKPVVSYGPEDHVSASTMWKYGVMQKLANVARKLPGLEPLQHPKL